MTASRYSLYSFYGNQYPSSGDHLLSFGFATVGNLWLGCIPFLWLLILSFNLRSYQYTHRSLRNIKKYQSECLSFIQTFCIRTLSLRLFFPPTRRWQCPREALANATIMLSLTVRLFSTGNYLGTGNLTIIFHYNNFLLHFYVVWLQ